MAAVAVQRTTMRWITGDDEVEATGWADLATKIKAPAAKKGASSDRQRLALLNYLGRQGWELVSQQRAPALATGTWTFKRRVKK
jgi:hypothetical protein